MTELTGSMVAVVHVGMEKNGFTVLKALQPARQTDVQVVPPVSKTLACGDVGIGAMAEPSNIANAVLVRKQPNASVHGHWAFPTPVFSWRALTKALIKCLQKGQRLYQRLCEWPFKSYSDGFCFYQCQRLSKRIAAPNPYLIQQK